MPRHEQVKIEVGNRKAHVDEGMAELIAACWRLGIDTHHSCQNMDIDDNDDDEYESYAYILFPTVSDLEKFYKYLIKDQEIKVGLVVEGLILYDLRLFVALPLPDIHGPLRSGIEFPVDTLDAITKLLVHQSSLVEHR